MARDLARTDHVPGRERAVVRCGGAYRSMFSAHGTLANVLAFKDNDQDKSYRNFYRRQQIMSTIKDMLAVSWTR
jgi:hypothetical protein